MNKSYFTILVFLAFLSVDTPVIAIVLNQTETKSHNVSKIETLINSSVKSNDYATLTKQLQETAKNDNLSDRDRKELENLLVKFSEKNYSQIDPAKFSAIIAPAVDLYPQNFRLSVKYLKSLVERAKIQSAAQFVSRIFDIQKTKTIHDDELEAVWLAHSGLQAMQIGQFGLAIDYYDKAIKKDPNWTGAYFLMAAPKAQLKKYEEATRLLDKVIGMNPRHEGAAEFKEFIARNK